MVGLELVRGDHAEATVEPAEVVPIDPRGGRELESVIVLYGPSWKTAPIERRVRTGLPGAMQYAC